MILKRAIIFILFVGLNFASGKAHAKKIGNIEITDEIVLDFTPVKNQGATGTCWSFATTSFLESEIIRMGKEEIDLSEMYFVGQVYKNKAKNYFYYHGHNNFSQGGQAHDVLDVIREAGLVTDDSYPGVKTDGKFSHQTLIESLTKEVKKSNSESRKFSFNNERIVTPLINELIGEYPESFTYKGEKYNPKSFTSYLGINPDDYIEIASFTHHPFYSEFVLEIPDNWSHSMYYNLPIEELMEVMQYSLKNGYTFCWDGDNSEKTFQHKKGIADLPEKKIGKVDQKLRQETFLNRKTTDDHLMHIVGSAKDENNRLYFNTKNSWGETSNKLGGLLYMSEDYVKLKTIAILVHKDAIPNEIALKLHLK